MSFESFTPFSIAANGVEIFGVKGGTGPALLLLHGALQSHQIWAQHATELARHFTVIATDLRGYGASAKPRSDVEHAAYAKRAMAADQIELMRQLGFERFLLCAHGRGTHVAQRMALDYPDAIERLMLLDAVPALALYGGVNQTIATAYFQWFFLLQAAPVPERLISADPEAYFAGVRHQQAGLLSATPEALAAWQQTLHHDSAVHAMCEDFRASATLDLRHERDDLERGRKIACPQRILWHRDGTLERCFAPLDEWRRVGRDVSGRALPDPHIPPEQAVNELLAEMLLFFETDGDNLPAIC
ncbi:alpha/beta hydrolase [Paraburkholderia bonniea]|uniref:alpha/beta fold hydrolase n=1 Tax=Paraburkholderia bonniea TaxID=2152891 RepID=UPI001291D49E|nr:alpha/beta hydrolase [Paraburkholderia bonniea]WJF90130.1 alpha/beta hydrolase [Paraburkholderia bonniea]WJF93444.1 alpha/beta hydrolase [Paraburkholderia bonniea]